MTAAFSLRVDGLPAPQGRPRFSTWRGFTRAIDPEKSRQWKDTVAKMALTRRPARPLEGPLRARLCFQLKRPKSLDQAVEFHTTKPDVDNLAKAVKDALSGIVYLDDCQIVILEVSKRYGVAPGVDIWVDRLNSSTNAQRFWDTPGRC